MLQIKGFNEYFLNEGVDEEGSEIPKKPVPNPKQTVALNYEDEFLEILKKINSPVSTILISLNKKELQSNIDTIGVGGDVENLKMVTVTTKGNRTSFTRTGRMLNKLIGLSGNKFHPQEVELFVNKYKAAYNYKKRPNNFKEVSGDELVEFYLSIDYDREDGVGQLGKSCMNKKPKEFFDLYKNNPDQVKLLVLLDEKSKMVARCLLWKTENGFNFMDRIYAYDDSDVELFKMHGDEKGYWYKEQQTTSYRNRGESAYQFYVVNNGNRKKEEITIKFENPRVSYYPYLDSLIYFKKSTGVLSNYRDNIGANMMLCRVDGGYKDPFRKE